MCTSGLSRGHLLPWYQRKSLIFCGSNRPLHRMACAVGPVRGGCDRREDRRSAAGVSACASGCAARANAGLAAGLCGQTGQQRGVKGGGGAPARPLVHPGGAFDLHRAAVVAAAYRTNAGVWCRCLGAGRGGHVPSVASRPGLAQMVRHSGGEHTDPTEHPATPGIPRTERGFAAGGPLVSGCTPGVDLSRHAGADQRQRVFL